MVWLERPCLVHESADTRGRDADLLSVGTSTTSAVQACGPIKSADTPVARLSQAGGSAALASDPEEVLAAPEDVPAPLEGTADSPEDVPAAPEDVPAPLEGMEDTPEDVPAAPEDVPTPLEGVADVP